MGNTLALVLDIDHMIVKIVTGLFPTENSSSGGVFIYERLKQLQYQQIPFEVYTPENQYSKLIQVTYKLLKQKILKTRVIEWDLASKQKIPQDNVTTLSLILSRIFPPLRLKKMVRTVERSMSFENDNVIHAHWTYPHGYVATHIAKKHNIPCIVTAHGSDIHTNPRKNKLIKKYTLKTLNSADKVIFVSHALLDSAKELGYSGENAVVIPNGIDVKYFYPMEKEEALKKTGWEQTKRYVVGFVGNLIPVKRADKFVEIFSEIQKRVQEVEFILVGDGDLADDIRLSASLSGLTVTFAGRVPHEDVCCWMNLFDVMILPSRNESWGCVVQEAYACGVPVVGAAVGGIPENLGGLCPSVADGDGFAMRFAAEVCKVLTGESLVDSKSLIDKAQSYTWEVCIEKEIEIYQELISQSNTR